MKDGKLLPWEVIWKYLRKGIFTGVEATGNQWVLLDGFPRMVSQGLLFEAIEVGLELNHRWRDWLDLSSNSKGNIKNFECHGAIFLKCSEEEMIRRTLTRGQGTTDTRVDDNHGSVLKRLKGYQEETMPVVEYFQSQGKIIEVWYFYFLKLLSTKEASTLCQLSNNNNS